MLVLFLSANQKISIFFYWLLAPSARRHTQRRVRHNTESSLRYLRSFAPLSSSSYNSNIPPISPQLRFAPLGQKPCPSNPPHPPNNTPNSASLRHASIRFATLRFASLCFATLRYAPLRSATLRYASLRYAPSLPVPLTIPPSL